MDSNFGKLSKMYASFSGKSLVGKKDHQGKVSGKQKNIQYNKTQTLVYNKTQTIVYPSSTNIITTKCKTFYIAPDAWNVGQTWLAVVVTVDCSFLYV